MLVSQKRINELKEMLRGLRRDQERLILEGRELADPELLQLANDERVLSKAICDLLKPGE